MAGNGPAIALAGLTKFYGRQLGVADLTFDVTVHEIMTPAQVQERLAQINAITSQMAPPEGAEGGAAAPAEAPAPAPAPAQ